MCDMDCFHCGKPDCVNDDLTAAERKSQDKRDRFALYDRKYGREKVAADYEKSEKGKARQKKYDVSEKGKARSKKYMQKLIDSGKNAERCRAYYRRKKEKRLKELLEGGAA